MKKILLFPCLLLTTVILNAQNVGIGTINPLFKLDVRNGSINTDSVYRIGSTTVLAVPGTGNLFIGKDVGVINTGSYNTFNGNFAGFSNLAGSDNSFFGQTAGYGNTSGNHNSFFGRSSGSSNTIGNYNSFFGRSAAYANTTGSYNTAIGNFSLTTITTGTLNTGLGYNVNVNSGAQINATAIGANARVDCDNCLVLGSVSGINSATSGVNVGIGLSTPNAKLSISANGTELVGTAAGNTLRTNAGILGSTAGNELSLANIGFLSSNNSSLGIRAYRSSAGTDWTTTALLIGYDVDNTVRASTGFLALSANGNMGINTVTPDSSALLDVNSTTKGFLPPRMTRVQILAISTPAEGLIIYNTTTKKPNYYNGTEWRNFDGSFIYEIGENYQGGIIAYFLQPLDPGYNAHQNHGLIAAATDQSTGVEWGCYLTPIPGGNGTVLGTGNQNTIDIMAGCATAGIAARICGDLVLNGYSDWYLPSTDELNKLYLNRVAVGGFSNSSYWSSSERDETYAWANTFLNVNGGPFQDAKFGSYRVRAVRSF